MTLYRCKRHKAVTMITVAVVTPSTTYRPVSMCDDDYGISAIHDGSSISPGFTDLIPFHRLSKLRPSAIAASNSLFACYPFHLVCDFHLQRSPEKYLRPYIDFVLHLRNPLAN
ncbi:hypothetical protein CSKR_201160 [Clonorchis sinensis]|uniref:Uncharacterized protein n=1 Tax=Clonorchis sinensis TaxID=79923 RepID=A0A8T1MLK5_CLOSI|nr:hypothetical protein CSKR_201160 [Clonorchis sinensis]